MSALKFKFAVTTLTERIQANRDKHEATHKEAVEGWYLTVKEQAEKAIRQFERVAKKAEERADFDPRGSDFTFYIREAYPEHHLADYDRVLDMLALTTAEEVELTAAEFGSYVRDEGSWSRDFAATSSVYVSNKQRLS